MLDGVIYGRMKMWHLDMQLLYFLSKEIIMCQICDCDDPPVFYRETFQAARKLHMCIECGQEIPVGGKYRYSIGKWYDWKIGREKIDSFHTCFDCTRDWDALLKIVAEKEGEEGCIIFGGLRDAVAEAFECECLNIYHWLVAKWQPELVQEYQQELVSGEQYILPFAYASGQLNFPFFQNGNIAQ